MQTAIHYVSKIIALAWNPLSWVMTLLVVGVVLLMFKPQRAIVWGRRFCATALLLLAGVGWQYPSNALLRELEDQYTSLTGDLSQYEGMVVLGGAFGGYDGRANGQVALSCAAERVVMPVPLMAEYPNMKLLFSGGSAAILTERGAEADVAEAYFKRMGVDMTRVYFERESRNTFENAVLSAKQMGETRKKPWLLVTSASHMPRAMATFQRAGWNVTAYPVDFQSVRAELPFEYSLDAGVADWALWIRETLGLVIYSVLGRT